MSTPSTGIDRSKFKKTSVSQLAQSDKELNKSLGRKEKGSQNGHELDEGLNLLRIYPVHPAISETDPTATFTHPFVQTFLPAMVEEKKDGKVVTDASGNAKLRESVKPVYNAIIHGKRAKDLVDEYIKLATSWAKEHIKNEDERKAFLEPVYGNYGKKINGITYPAKWVMYCDKYPGAMPDAKPVFDKFFFKKSIKERLNVLSQMESKNDPLGTDPYTDIETGRAISIKVDKEGGATGYYTTEFDSTTTSEVLKSGKTVKVAKEYPLSDEQLENFLAQKPLQELFGNIARRKNFEAQLAGLEMFDTKNKMGIFGLPAWDTIVIELDSYYPEDGAEATEEVPDETYDNDTIPEGDEFDLLNRQELQSYAKTNKTGILVKPGMSDDDIRTALRLWVESTVIPNDPLPGEEGYVEPEAVVPVVKEEVKDNFVAEMNTPVETVAEVKPQQTAKEKLDAMRKKMVK